MRPRARLRRSTRRSAVVKRQDQGHLRADAGTEETEELEQLGEEEIGDANTVAETEGLAHCEGESDAHRHEHAEGNGFAERQSGTFCIADAEKLAVTFVEIGQKEEGLADAVTEPNSFSVARRHAEPLARGERRREPVTRHNSVAVRVGRWKEGAIRRRDDRAERVKRF